MTIVIAAVVMAVLPDIYVWHVLARAGVSTVWCAASVVPTVVLVAVAAVGAAGHVTPAVMRIFFAVLLCVSLPKLLFTVVSLAGRAAALALPAAAHFVNVGAAALAVVTAAAFLYGFVFGWRRIVVREVEISSPRLPIVTRMVPGSMALATF